jgi:endonuclease YncB( thermonuclease family)
VAHVRTFDYAIDRVRKVVDGDTLDVDFHADIGFHIYSVCKVRLRLTVIDTPERGEPGHASATLFLSDWLRERGGYLRFTSHAEDREHGRWVSDVYDRRTGDTASAALLGAGLAKVWGT